MGLKASEIAQTTAQLKSGLEKYHVIGYEARTARPNIDGLENVDASDWGLYRTGATASWREPGKKPLEVLVYINTDSLEVIETDQSGRAIVYPINTTIGESELSRLESFSLNHDLRIGSASEERQAQIVDTLRRIAGQL